MVDVNVVAQEQKRGRPARGNCAPHPLVPGRVARSTSETDRELCRPALRRKGPEPSAAGLVLPIDGNRIIVHRVRFQPLDGKDGGVVLPRVGPAGNGLALRTSRIHTGDTNADRRLIHGAHPEFRP